MARSSGLRTGNDDGEGESGVSSFSAAADMDMERSGEGGVDKSGAPT